MSVFIHHSVYAAHDFGISVHVFVPRTQKFPKFWSSITTCLAHAERDRIIFDATLRATTSKHASERRESLIACSAALLFHGRIVI